MSNVIAEFEVNTQQTVEAEFSVNVVNNDHNTLKNRDMADQHQIDAITGLREALDEHTDAQWGRIKGDIDEQTDLQNALDAKQDVISDLSTIRSGASAGATAVQNVTTGTTNGTIKVDGNSVSVYGLGSAAYTASTAYDAAGSASTAETSAKNYADSLASNYATSAQGALADTALQPNDIANMQTTTNLVTSVSSASTDSQYPSAKLF